MTTDVILFLLRLIAGGLLLGILAVLFIVMYRDYRGAVTQVEANRRVYGRLVMVEETPDGYIPNGKLYPLLPLTSLGRSPTNTIHIPDDFASSEHALVALRGGQWWLEDRHSRNGTTINGLALTQPVVITDGDVIGIGTRRFRLELEN